MNRRQPLPKALPPRPGQLQDGRIIEVKIAAVTGFAGDAAERLGCCWLAALTMIKKPLSVRFLLMSQADRMVDQRVGVLWTFLWKAAGVLWTLLWSSGRLPAELRSRGRTTTTCAGPA